MSKDFDIVEKLVFSIDDPDKRLGIIINFIRNEKRNGRRDMDYYVDIIRRAINA